MTDEEPRKSPSGPLRFSQRRVERFEGRAMESATGRRAKGVRMKALASAQHSPEDRARAMLLVGAAAASECPAATVGGFRDQV